MKIVFCTVLVVLSAGCFGTTRPQPVPDRLWGEVSGDEKALVYAAGAGYIHLTPEFIIVQITGDPNVFRNDFEALFNAQFDRAVKVSDTAYRMFFQRGQ